MFPLLQLFLLTFATVLFHISVTNPNQSYASDHVAYEGFGAKFMTFVVPKIVKLLIWISTLYQGLYIYLQAFSPSLIPTIFPQVSTSINLLPLTPISLLGYICIIIGGLGRIWCYKTLGRFFTFEVTIRKSHKLIQTGPYAYVRHPSYTSVFILAIGMVIILERLTNFFPNIGWVQNIFSPIGFLIYCIVMALIFVKRVSLEEEELMKAFGQEWTQYASKTKRFIPGVI